MVHETIHIGLIILFLIVLVPTYAMVVGWFVGRPREFRTPLLGIGYLVGFTILLLIGTWLFSQLIGFIMSL